MAEQEKKPVQSVKKDDRKMVPESDLIALKKRNEKLEDTVSSLKGELADTKAEVVNVRSELKIAKVDSEDAGEISEVKQYLLNEEKRLNQLRTDMDKDLTSRQDTLTKREREVGAKELVEKYGVDFESISGEDNLAGMEKKATELYTERLARENEELKGKEKNSPEYETENPSIVKTTVKGMSDEEFEQHWAKQKQEALSK